MFRLKSFKMSMVAFLTTVMLHSILHFGPYQGHTRRTLSHRWNGDVSFARNGVLQHGREGAGNRTMAGIPKEKYDFLLRGRVDCNKPWVSITDEGKLGTKICSLFHLLDVKYKYGLQVGLMHGMWKSLRHIFPYLHIHLLPQQCFEEVKDMKPVHHTRAFQQLAAEGPIRNMLISGSPCSVANVWFLRDVFIDEFKFDPSILQEAQVRLDSLLETWKEQMNKRLPHYKEQSGRPTVVGVHVRRGDYKHRLKKMYDAELFPAEYFRVAFARARQMFGLVAFVVMSDDLDWCRNYLEPEHADVVVPTKKSRPEIDMALLTLSEHVIASIGTYSTSGAVLAGGKFFFPVRNFSKSEKRYGIQAHRGVMNLTDTVPVWYNHEHRS